MKILAVGGGTLGPVMPLLAVHQAMQRLEPAAKFLWVGTPGGPEKDMVRDAGIPFYSITVAKWPRYPSWRWFSFPADWFRARREAEQLLDRLRPDVILSAGGFTAVPIMYAASHRGMPCVAHQLDLIPGRSNVITAKLCERITTSFAYEHRPFHASVADEPIPTPTLFSSHHLPSQAEARRHFHLDPHRPVTFVIGGGTGSGALNELVHQELKEWLTITQILHSTGKGKGIHLTEDRRHKGYHGQELYEKDMRQAYAASDVVMARAGIGTLSEVAALKKPTILIPLPNSPQEANARAFEEQGAALVFPQGQSDLGPQLRKTLGLLLADRSLQQELGESAHRFFPTDDGTALAKVVLEVVVRRAK